jgi:hypothetical protein
LLALHQAVKLGRTPGPGRWLGARENELRNAAMDPGEIPALKAADDLLREAEKTYPSQESSKKFLQAFETLNNLMQLEEPNSEVARFVNNLKSTHIRSVVARLKKVGKKDLDQHVHYGVAVFFHLNDDVTNLRAADPKIATTLDSCRLKFKPQIDKFVGAM